MFTKIKQLLMKQFTVCPRTGKITGLKIGERKALLLWILLGLASVIWVLIRVVPKPSRTEYPCQKVAQPIAAGFIAWLLGLIGSLHHAGERASILSGVNWIFFHHTPGSPSVSK